MRNVLYFCLGEGELVENKKRRWRPRGRVETIPYLESWQRGEDKEEDSSIEGGGGTRHPGNANCRAKKAN